MVVDGDMEEVEAVTGGAAIVPPVRVEASPTAIRDAREALHVDVQEVAGRGVLVADYLARHAIEPAELVQSVPDEDLHAGRCANVRRSCAGKRPERSAVASRSCQAAE
jgi:hypothetical protein